MERQHGMLAGEGGGRRRPVVLSAEQALSMPYATLRFAHLGWRVIRIEPTPAKGRRTAGDPNRWIGRVIAGEDRHSYFVAPNVGKEAIALDLKRAEGRAALDRIVAALDVDVFCTNTMPARHEALGITAERLRASRPGLIWCGISAMGLAEPDVPGYDPVLQAHCGYMDLTGDPDGSPMQCGIPLIDLKAGDEAFAQVLHALYERTFTGEGCTVDVSMARCAVAWLQTFLPMLEMGSSASEIRRAGNEHRQFIPVNAYPSRDGYVYIAVGSDAQWARLTSAPMFASLAQERFATNEWRRMYRGELHDAIGFITREHASRAIDDVLSSLEIPHAPITAIENVGRLPFVRVHRTKTVTPDGRSIDLPPAAVDTDYLRDRNHTLEFAPAYGEHTDRVLCEAGFTSSEVSALRAGGVIA